MNTLEDLILAGYEPPSNELAVSIPTQQKTPKTFTIAGQEYYTMPPSWQVDQKYVPPPASETWKRAISTGIDFMPGPGDVKGATQGELAVRIHLCSGARPGVVFLAIGLGHKAYDEYIQHKGVNANDVTEVQIDPVTGLGTVWSTRAQLRRA